MILEGILENYLMGNRGSQNALFIEMSIPPEFFPSIVSSARGSFLISRHQHPGGVIRVGVFNPYGRLDDFIPPLFEKALQFSTTDKFPNVFRDSRSAFDYVRTESGEEDCPRFVLIPSEWKAAKIRSFFGTGNLKKEKENHTYMKVCKVIPVVDLKFPVFLSRPDYVGVLNTFGSNRSILLHNVEKGMAFVVNPASHTKK